jgi:hypothetical protein
MLKIDEGDVSMLNQQVCPNNFIERMSTMQKDEIQVVKADVKKSKYNDITQTKEFWSKLAVLS